MLKFLDDKGEVSNISSCNNMYNNTNSNNNNYAEDFVNQNSFDNDIACNSNNNANKDKVVNTILSKNSKFKEVLLLLDNNDNINNNNSKRRSINKYYNTNANVKYNSNNSNVNTIDAITKYKHKIKSLTPRNDIVSKHQHNHHNHNQHPLQTTKQNKISFQIKQIYNDIQSFSKQKQKTIPSIPKLNIPIGGGKNKLNTLLHHNHNHKHHIHITPKTTRTNTKIPLYHHYHYTKPLFYIPKHTNTFINTKHGITSWITTEKTNQCNSYYLEKKKGIQTLFGSIKQSNSYDRLPTHPQHHIRITTLTQQQQRPQSYIIHTQRDFYKTHLALFDKHISSTLY